MSASTDRLWQRSHAYLASGQTAAARAVLETLVARDPAHTRAHLILGGIAWMGNRAGDALRHARDAVRTVPEDPLLIGAVVAALLQVGDYAAARQLLDRPCLAAVREPALLMQMAGARQRLGDHAAALALHERAHAAGLDGPEYRYHHATQLAFNGRLADAKRELEACIGLGAPLGRAFVELARLDRQTPESNHLEAIARMLAIVPRGSEDHAGLEFARYKELEDLGRHDAAWGALASGNAIMAARVRYDAAREERLLESLRAVCTSRFLEPVARSDEGAQPIFVIGMTRSGTTLLDRILGNHSQVESAGELGDFGRQLRNGAGQCTLELLDERILERLPCVDFPRVGADYLAQTQWRANGKARFVDKFPPNWQLAGLIARALPQARILHMVRDPMDVCFSNFRALFGESYAWSYDLDGLAHYHRQYRRTMAHWHAVLPGRILDVAYADLVRDPEGQARRIFAFCGLAHEDGCAQIHRNTTAVATLSVAQVRGGIRADAFEQWRPYAQHLAPLAAKLDAAG